MIDQRDLVRKLSSTAADTENPLSWFEELYMRANRDERLIPWSDGNPNPILVDWAIGKPTGKAIVVGSGLGDDAAFLDDRGWQVTAFDISSTAIDWSRERFGQSSVRWMVADLLNLPMDWIGGFDLVLEIHTLQAMPEELRAAAAKKLAPLVSENGHLVCIGRYTSGDVGIEGPPWPLERSFIEGIGQDLGRMNLVKFRLPLDEISVTRFRATWERRMVKIN